MKQDLDLRQKYLDALAQLEAGEARWARLETILRTLVGRLCLAARGRAVPLDGELRKLSDLVRRRSGADEIEASIEPLSRAVAALDEVEERPGEVAPRAAGSPAAGSQAQSNAAPIAAPAADPGRIAQVPFADRDARETRVQAAIVSTLERLALLPELRPALAELHDRSTGELSAEDFAEGLERVARLIGEQRASLQRERLKVEELLLQMDARLEGLASYLAGEAAELRSAQESTQKLDALVLNEVHELNTDVQGAADLEGLRDRVRTRLETITDHLQAFRAHDAPRACAQIDRTLQMRVRVGELEREIHGLKKTLQDEQSLRMIDALTGIPNRAAYDDRIEHEFMRFQRQRAPVSILAWDVDRFKAVNDAYGHNAGDKVLTVIAQYLAKQVRGTDFVARYGGEEFVMILVGTNAQQSALAADKIRVGIANLGFHFHNEPVAVTASCGITTIREDDTPQIIFDRADRALYLAKGAGRNCCRIV